MNAAEISALAAAVVAVIGAATALVKVIRHQGQAASTAHSGLLPGLQPTLSMPPTGTSAMNTVTAGAVSPPPVITYSAPTAGGGAGGGASPDAGSVTVSPPVNVTGGGGGGSAAPGPATGSGGPDTGSNP